MPGFSIMRKILGIDAGWKYARKISLMAGVLDLFPWFQCPWGAFAGAWSLVAYS
jgi:hypothetical protein